MSRLSFALALALSLSATYAHAQSQAEIANQENEEGKQLMFAGKYAEASAKFQDAVARVPEAKYFFNLCMSRYQEGKFGEALTACNAVAKNGPSDELKVKADKLTTKVQDEAKKQGIDLQPAGGGAAPGDTPPDGSTTAGNPGGTTVTPPPGGTTVSPTGAPPTQAAFAVGRPPTQGVFQAAPPEHHYTWTLGVDLYAGGGQLGQKDWYGSAATGIRFKGDYLINPAAKLGAEAYLQITHFGQGKMQASLPVAPDQLDVFDIGLAGYKHLCLAGVQRLCLTPLVGVQLAMLAPGSQQTDPSSTVSNYTSVGGRAQISADFAFGSQYEHVLSAMFGVNVYSAVLSADATADPPETIGLDKGGAFAYFGVGYTYRFDTPFGQAPFVTLE